MFYTLNVSLTCALMCLPLVFCGEKDQNLTTVINIYTKTNDSGDGIAISECVADNVHYYIITNQSVQIKFHHKVQHYILNECDTPPLKITFVNETIRFPNLLMQDKISSVGQEEWFEHCSIRLNYNTIGYVYPPECLIYKIYITDTNNLKGKLTNNRFMINTYLTVDPEIPNKMTDVVYQKDSNLHLICTELGISNYTQVLLIKDKDDRTEILKRGEYLNGLFMYNMDESLNDKELMLLVKDKIKNTTVTAGIKLKYETNAESPSVTLIVVTTLLVLVLTLGVAIVAPRLYSKLKDKLHKRVENSSARYNGALRTPIENEYDFIYDSVYEDRRRLQRAASEAQQKREDERQKPPTPPPVETIPVQKVPVPAVTNVRRYSMLTPASDMYLLQIDSEGYQIPEIVQMKGIQLDEDEPRK